MINRVTQCGGSGFRYAAVVAAMLMIIAACGDSDDPTSSATTNSTPAPSESSAAPTTAPATSAVASTEAPATTAAAPDTSVAPSTTTTVVEQFSTDVSPRMGEAQGEPSGQLVDVRMARQDGFDRFVLEFAGTGTPSYRVEYTEGPIVRTNEDVVDVAGTSLLRVIAFPARTFDFEDPDFAKTYEGPEVITSDTLRIIEAVFVEDFEANMEWILGMDAEAGFEVTVLNDPPRIVVDVTND